MIDLKHRSNASELMDDPALPVEALIPALNDITKVNKLLNGNMITIKAIARLFKEFPEKKVWHIVDFGCGDGQMLRRIGHYFRNHPNTLELVGVDINLKSVALARSLSTSFENITYETTDILEIAEEDFSCDLLLCTLTMHHFTDEEIVVFIKKFSSLARVAVIINDLERSAIAYQLFNVFSRIFMKSSIAKHDGRVSIARSFKRKELEQYAQHIGLKEHTITWKWAFRYLWLIKTL